MAASDFEDTEVLLIDGNNLLHRTVGTVEPDAQRGLFARLRAVLPPTVRAVVMLDGHAAPGSPRQVKLAGNLEVRHAGSLSADDALLEIVRAQRELVRADTTIVTDDRSLTERARTLGARTRRLDWLSAILDRPLPRNERGSAIGAGRPPPTQPAAEDRKPWSVGRGATRKKGNPRRRPR